MTTDPLNQSRPEYFGDHETRSFDPRDPNVVHGIKITAVIILMIPFMCVPLFSLYKGRLPLSLMPLAIYTVYYILCVFLRLFGVKALAISDIFHELSHWVGAALLNLKGESLRLTFFPSSPSKRFPHKLGNPHLSIFEPIPFNKFAVVALFPILALLVVSSVLTLIIPTASWLWWSFLSVFLAGSIKDLSWVLMVIERGSTQRLVLDHGDHLLLQ